MSKFVKTLTIIFAIIATTSNATEIKQTNLEISKSCNITKNIASDSLNLADVIELAMCNNPKTRQAWINTKVGSTAYNKSLSNYFPKITATATYQDTQGENYSDPTAAPVIRTIGKTMNSELSLSWLLYDFGAREANIENTFQTMNSLNFQYNDTLQQVAFETISAYYDALSAVEELAALKSDEEASKKSFELAFRKFELGMSSKADTLQTETTYANRQLSTTKQEQVVLTTRANLAKLLGLPPNQNIKLVSSYASTTDELISKSVDDIIAIAMQKRPDLASKISSTKALYADVRKASATFFPTISGFASKSWIDDDAELNSLGTSRTNEAVGVRVSLPIFTGFENTYSLRNAKYKYAASLEELESLKQDIELSVVNTYNEYKTSIKALSLAKKMYESASENEQVALGSYKAGKGDIIRLMEAQSKLVSARKEIISAQYGLYTSKIALLKSAGELNLKNLGELQ